MILKAPSGFYKTLIPPAVGNSGSVTYTISSGLPPFPDLNFNKITRLASIGKIISDETDDPPYISTLRHSSSEVATGIEPRPSGSIIEFNDQFRTLNISEVNEVNEFISSDFRLDEPINKDIIIAYDRYRTKLLEVSEKLRSVLTIIENDEIALNVNIAKLQAISEALKIIPDSQLLESDRETTIKSIEEIELRLVTNRLSVGELDKERLELSTSTQKLSKVI
jgi:transcriptional regulator with XRE-family HTH domain